MSFIQCKDGLEVEKKLEKGFGGFVSSDFRIYDTITFYDNDCSYEINSKEFLEIASLRDQLKFMNDGRMESSFNDLVSHSEELQKCFKVIIKNLGIK